MLKPKIDNHFICIVDREKTTLATLILSYINQSKGYIPTFEFSFVSSEDFKTQPEKEVQDEHQMSRSKARKFNIRVANTIGFLGGCKYLIVAGLSHKQLSYLTFLDKYNTIYINSVNDVEPLLNGIVPKNGSLTCKESELINTLSFALKNNLYLRIDNETENVSQPREYSSGLIVIEKNNKVSSVFAILYAHSIGAEVELVDSEGLNNYEIKEL